MNDKNKIVEFIFVIFALCIMCLGAVAGGYVLEHWHIPLEATPSATIIAPASTLVSLNSAIACTDIPGGYVNVRSNAVNSYPEVRVLAEGQTLQIKNDSSPRTAVNGIIWIEVTSPISRWVDQSSICYQNQP